MFIVSTSIITQNVFCVFMRQLAPREHLRNCFVGDIIFDIIICLSQYVMFVKNLIFHISQSLKI